MSKLLNCFPAPRRVIALLISLAFFLSCLAGCGLIPSADPSDHASLSSSERSPREGSSQSESSSEFSSTTESSEGPESDPSVESSTEDPSLEDLQEDPDPGNEETAASPTSFYDPSGIDYDRLLASRNQVYVEGSGIIYPSDGLAPKEQARYTLLIYMTGSNLESTSARATLDMLEMADSGLSFEDVNVILYAGGCQSWKNNIPSTQNSVIDLSLDPSEYIIAATEGNADMGAAETLREFLKFGVEYYPADHYSLIFWDHGGGPLWGYGNDELFSGDALLLSEMKEAMDATPFSADLRLDFVGFDACLMGSYEVMSLWANYADHMIASEELEPGDGWDYHFLSVLNDTSDPKTIGTRIVDDYEQYYKALSTDTYQPNITLSLVDLTKLKDLSEAMEPLFKALASGLQTGQYTELKRIRMDSKSFGIVETRDSGTYYYDLVDLYDLVNQLSFLYDAECKEVTRLLSEFVLHHTSTMENTGGVSLYYPSQNKGQYEKLGEVYKEIATSDAYIEYLDTATMDWLYSKSRDWVLGSPEEVGSELTLQLTDDQLQHMAACYYSVLMGSESSGAYYPAIDHVRVEPDSDGVIHVPTEPEVFFLSGSALGDNTEWPVRQIEKTDTLEIYQTLDTYLYSDLYRYYRGEQNQQLPVTITFSYAPETKKVSILSFSAVQNDFNMGGKESLDLSQWQSIFSLFGSRVPIRDQKGSLLPFSQWALDDKMTWTISVPLFGDYTIEKAETDHHLAYQIVVEDENGELYASELCLPMNVQPPFETASYVNTENGVLYYLKYSDHILIERYEGSDTTLVIPETIQGLPVTIIETLGEAVNQFGSTLTSVVLPSTTEIISRSAFNNCTNLVSVDIPEGVTYIGDQAFSHCSSLESITIPSTVTYLGNACFDSCTSLRSITLPPELEYVTNGMLFNCPSLESIQGEAKRGYQIIDGALFNEDGTVLMAYPAARSGSYRIPDGTKEIGFGAFSSTSLSSIVIPEGVTRLASYAFYQSLSLAFPALPASLGSIGFRCFGVAPGSLSPDQIPSVPSEIVLGANIAYIGDHAFDVYPSRVFSVDPENPFFASLSECLVNKAQDTLYELSGNKQLNYIVPEGIVSFDYKVLSLLDGFTNSEYLSFDLFLPDSLLGMTGDVPAIMDQVVIHSSPGSFAQILASEEEFAWNGELQTDYTIATVATEKGMIYARVYADHAMILLYNGDDVNITLPETIEGVPVTILGNGSDPIEYSTNYREGVYADLTLDKESLSPLPLLSILIPDSVTTISAHCFEANPLIAASLVLPPNLKVVGDDSLPYKYSGDPYDFPETLEYLGTNNLGYCNPIPITENTKYISPNQFFQEGMVYAFQQFSSNDVYTVKNGSLYSKDGKTLIRWGANDTGSMSVPEGVTTIGPYALGYTSYADITFPESLTTIQHDAAIGCQVTSLVFPESLETIEKDAFFFCTKLESVTFNEGLKYIGERAFINSAITYIELPESLAYIGLACFGYNHGYSALKEGETFDLYIGKNLLFIDVAAFDALPISNYHVDPENPVYASVGGLLYDSTKCILMDCPCGKQGSVFLSDRTTLIKSIAFHSCVLVTDVYMPDTVFGIQVSAFDDAYYTMNSQGEWIQHPGYWITVHCTDGGYVNRYVYNMNIPFVVEKKIKTYGE